MNLQENINRIQEVMGVIVESEIEMPDYAVIEIMKPISYLPLKYYFQAIPIHHLDSDRIYVNKGAAGGKSISTKNIKVLKTFKYNEKDEMESYLNNLRDNQ
jgi:hypothetical protein